MSDEIGTNLLLVSVGLVLRNAGRCPVENPSMVANNDEEVTFFHYEGNGIADEAYPNCQRSTDYKYRSYWLLQELGVIKRYESDNLQERLEKSTITFKKSVVTDDWKSL